MDASQHDYTVAVAGLEGWSGGRTCAEVEEYAPAQPWPPTETPKPPPPPKLFQEPVDSPAPSDPGQMSTDYKSVERSGRPETGNGPTRPRGKKARYTPYQQGLRRLQVREFARDHYLAAKALSVRTVGLVNDLLAHLARFHGQTTVRELTGDFFQGFRDYLVGLIADGEMGAANANKQLRQLKALANRATTKGEFKQRNHFNDFLPEKKPQPHALNPGEGWKIREAARRVSGFVGSVPAGVWWLAWYLTMSRAGNRLTALMKAQRGDYQHGVLWLRADNQKQDEDQRLALPGYCHGPIEDLLAAHDEPLLFPWPWDRPKPGKEATWNTLFRRFRAILATAGIATKKGVLTRIFRQTAGTVVEELGGSGMKLLGHSTPGVFKKHYQDPSRGPVTRDAPVDPRGPAAPAAARQTAHLIREGGRMKGFSGGQMKRSTPTVRRKAPATRRKARPVRRAARKGASYSARELEAFRYAAWTAGGVASGMIILWLLIH